ncbi:hypothetical protein BDN71DRAFT_1384458 [Pleurotus eryngii]|uniref:C2H2-type domain-containing protein n=1 Tax=Pleurotus eryngii TaxID=5323 RepID=A0A9P6A7L1_PLEER|nr:hypothetical protein BDN71DRAFT_1384458 [Pleurotus eryngii]
MLLLRRLKCPYPGCSKQCRRQSALTKHVRSRHSASNVVLHSAMPPSHSPPKQHFPDRSEAASSESEGDHCDNRQDTPPSQNSSSRTSHPYLTGDICDAHGQQIPPDEVPPLREPPECAWAPFTGPSEFLLADLLFRKVEMSTTRQNELFDILNMMLEAYGDASPFSSSQDMYNTIDSAHVGGVPWECLVSMPSEDLPHDAPIWKRKPYEIWYRNPDAVLRSLLDNPDFHGEFDYTPYIELDEEGKRCWTDFFSGNFAWRHSSTIYEENPAANKGAIYCPIITGSDKTTVSVATGQVEYHPGYLSIGNVHNNVRRAHCGAVVPFIFFAIPKSDRKYDGDPEFRTFKWQLYHRSLSTVLDHIKPSMSTPVVRRCPDGHFRRVVFDLGPVIADYPEQVLLAGTVQRWCAKCTALPEELDDRDQALPRSQEYTDQLISTFDPGVLWDSYGIDDDIVPFTNDFPRADIHELLSPDLLHQVIKGTFKDHLVEWVGVYLTLEHGKAQAEVIMDEIDHQIAAVPPFPNLRQFPDGRRFKQWTGDDSKALMKVYLPTLVDFVPSRILWMFTSFLDFCYHARRTHFNEDTLNKLDLKVHQFQDFREVFQESGVRPTGFALPRQHSLTHYHHLIQEFGAPYGLCSSITESRHITAVKKPWRRSNRYNALGQMLQTNQRLDKLAALQTDYISRGLLPPTHDKKVLQDDNDDNDGAAIDEVVTGSVTLAHRRAPNYPRTLDDLGIHINIPQLTLLTRRFLYDQLHPNSFYPAEDVPENLLPSLRTPVSVFHSAVATYYAPSDMSGRYGMYCERIRCTPNWRREGPRRDTVFLVEDDDQPGLLGMSVVRLRLLFSFKHVGVTYPCALVDWFDRVGQRPDPNTGLWIVKPDLRGRSEHPFCTVIHLDSLLRAAHLIPVYGPRALPLDFKHQYTLDSFRAFFVNKHIDYHAFELLS